jgi:hypothetical protein
MCYLTLLCKFYDFAEFIVIAQRENCTWYSLTIAGTKGILTSFPNIPTTTRAPPLFRILKASLVVFSAPTQSITISTPFPVIFVICSQISGA